jgi:hypothetical protein
VPDDWEITIGNKKHPQAIFIFELHKNLLKSQIHDEVDYLDTIENINVAFFHPKMSEGSLI